MIIGTTSEVDKTSQVLDIIVSGCGFHSQQSLIFTLWYCGLISN